MFFLKEVRLRRRGVADVGGEEVPWLCQIRGRPEIDDCAGNLLEFTKHRVLGRLHPGIEYGGIVSLVIDHQHVDWSRRSVYGRKKHL